MSDLPARLRSSDGWKVFTAGDGERAFTVDTDLMDEAADRIEQLEAMLRDTAAAVEFEDDRIGYVSVQMDRDVWLKYRVVQP